MKLNTQAQIDAAEKTLRLTWAIVCGAVLFSILTITPLVERVTPDGWDWTAPILPLVVDAAVVIVVRVDAIVARLDGDAGGWPMLLRWLTGAMTLALNVGDSALKGDPVGVGVHAVAPVLLIVTAEASLKWRRAITVAVARIERERAEADVLKARERKDREDRSRADQEARRKAEADERERERAEREREREQVARLDRERREHERQVAQEEREDQARREQAARDDAARQRREEQDREDRLRREERERVERDRKAKAEQDKAKEQDLRRRVAAAATAPRPAVSAPVSTPPPAVSTPAHEGAQQAPADDKMSEADARKAVADAVREGRSQRATAALTGWSTGWVANRYRELEQVPGQLEMSTV
ncbi:DUF2637 domain-containing protein [Streptomyces sp. NPDC059193]|uniref:DUF2637 domain-containing protein n=1 Tax=Streptomyces sp. NPDC059193 TaxID=3346763 RepID=UPI0036D0CCE9